MQASPVLLVHVGAGTVGLLSGTVAICVRKGSRMHAKWGVVFAVAMLVLAATGVWVAYARVEMGNVVGGVVTFYMIATAWVAGRRRERRVSWFDWAAMAVALVGGAWCVRYGYKVSSGAVLARDGVPAGMEFFLGGVMLLAGAGDVWMIVRGGVDGAQRIARHLWRMCFGLFIASGSFFMGRQAIFPGFVRTSGILIVLTVLPLLLLVFWMVRVRLLKRGRREFGSEFVAGEQELSERPPVA